MGFVCGVSNIWLCPPHGLVESLVETVATARPSPILFCVEPSCPSTLVSPSLERTYVVVKLLEYRICSCFSVLPIDLVPVSSVFACVL